MAAAPAFHGRERACDQLRRLRLRGSINAGHGICALQRDELIKRKSPMALSLMKRVKEALDPQR
jgi:hypothetical protein